MRQKRKLAVAPAMVLATLLGCGSGQAWADDDLTKSFEGWDWGVDFRHRLEFVDQDGKSKDAEASTLRTRLNIKSPEASGFSLFVEFDYVAEILLDDFDQGGGNTPDRGQYPVVADPDGDDWNQAYIQYKNGKNQVRAGRQRIILDNARFVGNVGWRQNEQTYDAASYQYKGDLLNFQYAYIDNVNRIFGDDVPAGDHSQSTHIVNVNFPLDGAGSITGYLYDIDNEDSASNSTTTYGLRYLGKKDALAYTVEWAMQKENANNTVDYDAHYWRIDLSYALDGVTPYVGYEALEGDAVSGGKSFRTPLATLHAFNGWADKFLGTPATGLEDLFVGVKGKVGAWSWNVLWHDFSSEATSGDFGSELDASIARKFAKRYGLLVKVADFDSDSPSYADTTKFWVQFTAAF